MERSEKEDLDVFEKDVLKNSELSSKKIKTEIIINLTDIYNTYKVLSNGQSNAITNKVENKIHKFLDEI